VDCEKSGMADMVFEMIQDADIDTRAEYYKHIVLSGNALCIVTATGAALGSAGVGRV
jgi:hypothetical protein